MKHFTWTLICYIFYKIYIKDYCTFFLILFYSVLLCIIYLRQNRLEFHVQMNNTKNYHPLIIPSSDTRLSELMTTGCLTLIWYKYESLSSTRVFTWSEIRNWTNEHSLLNTDKVQKSFINQFFNILILNEMTYELCHVLYTKKILKICKQN